MEKVKTNSNTSEFRIGNNEKQIAMEYYGENKQQEHFNSGINHPGKYLDPLYLKVFKQTLGRGFKLHFFFRTRIGFND